MKLHYMAVRPGENRIVLTFGLCVNVALPSEIAMADVCRGSKCYAQCACKLLSACSSLFYCTNETQRIISIGRSYHVCRIPRIDSSTRPNLMISDTT